jgi:branched-chain amino acid transport system permease protein
MAIGAYAGGVVTYYGAFYIWGTADIQPATLSDSLHPALTAWPWLNGADLLFLSGCLLGGLAAAVVGFVVGLPSLRLRGDYLAIVTLGFNEIVRRILEQTRPILHGREEIAAMPLWRLLTHVGGSLGFTSIHFYTSLFWVYLWVAGVLLVALRLKYSTYGRAFLAIRENEIAAASVGIPVTRFKVRAFMMSAFFAGLAGCLLIHLTGTIKPEELGFMRSFEIVIMVVLGGMGSVSGSVLAAVSLTVLYYGLREIPNASQYRMIVYALALVIIMILRPQGLLGLHEVWELRLFRRRELRGASAP